MRKRLSILLLGAALLVSAARPALAQLPCPAKPDDTVTFDLSAENWVTTKTARVILSVEAAVAGNATSAARAAMLKAVSDTQKGDWRLIHFSRSQDQTGMERWSAQFEARIPEAELNGLTDNAKKNSKAGLQVTVAAIEFTPTLDETQTVLSQIRTQIYKQANDQLDALNKALPGRGYRIASIDFSGGPLSIPSAPRAIMAMAKAANDGTETMNASFAPMEKSQKLTLSAHIVLAAATPLPKEAGK